VRRRQYLPADGERAGIEEAGGAIEPVDLPLLEVGRVDRIEAADEGITGRLEPAPVVPVHGQVEAIAARILGRVRQHRGGKGQLLRHAADVDAGASQAPGLDQCDARAVLGGALRGGEAAAAAADRDVVVVDGH